MSFTKMKNVEAVVRRCSSKWPATLLKRDSNTVSFLKILQSF